jgi:hypothetical protein
MMPDHLKELLRALNDHEVKYLIVGGYAFGVHAEPRATKEIARRYFVPSLSTERFSPI